MGRQGLQAIRIPSWHPFKVHRTLATPYTGGLAVACPEVLYHKIRAIKGLDKVLARDYSIPVMAKYDSMRKLDRNMTLREYSESHPELSLKEIGRIFNITESRVWRIIHKKAA